MTITQYNEQITDYSVATDTSIHGGPKNILTCFCQNFIKPTANLIIFGKQIAKMIKLCKIHSLSTSR